MLVLQLKNNNAIKLIDRELGTPESKLKDIERVMVYANAGIMRGLSTTPHAYSFHEYVTYTLYQMVDEYFESVTAIGESGWDEDGEYLFVNGIYDHTLEAIDFVNGIYDHTSKAIDDINRSENKIVLDKVLIIEDSSGKDHKLHVCIQSAVVVNQ